MPAEPAEQWDSGDDLALPVDAVAVPLLTGDVGPGRYVPGPTDLLVASVESSSASFIVIPDQRLRLRVWGWHISNGGTADRTLTLQFSQGQRITKVYLVFQGGQSNFYLWPKSILGPWGQGITASMSAAGATQYVNVFYTFEDRPDEP